MRRLLVQHLLHLVKVVCVQKVQQRLERRRRHVRHRERARGALAHLVRKGGREDVAALAEDVCVRAEGDRRRLAVDGLDGDVGAAPLGEEGEEVGLQRRGRHLDRGRLLLEGDVCLAQPDLRHRARVRKDNRLLDLDLEGDRVVDHPLAAKQLFKSQPEQPLRLRLEVGAAHKASDVVTRGDGDAPRLAPRPKVSARVPHEEAVAEVRPEAVCAAHERESSAEGLVKEEKVAKLVDVPVGGLVADVCVGVE
mmetsp:Transcript_22402/g.71639  ORF Transcript_22402/g.71639 Transcript_22402/m.71639 type:complete len:251 (+) Transcript_22402:623-1375(+)